MNDVGPSLVMIILILLECFYYHIVSLTTGTFPAKLRIARELLFSRIVLNRRGSCCI